MDNLKDKTALVTGASRGIGAATAQLLAERGAHVIIHYGTSEKAAREIQKKICSAGGTSQLLQGDLADADVPARLAAETVELLEGRPLDILVHNAGVAEYHATAETPAASIDRMTAINLRAPFLLTAALDGQLAEGAAIVFLTTAVTETYFPNIAAYAATKGAVDTLIRYLAAEYGPRGIRVNGVAPGAIATDMSAWLNDEAGKTTALSIQALQRVGQPEDIARIVVWLASPAAGWVTGDIVTASGGTKL